MTEPSDNPKPEPGNISPYFSPLFAELSSLHGALRARGEHYTAPGAMGDELLAIGAALEHAYNRASDMQLGAEGFDNMETARHFDTVRRHLLAASEEILAACRSMLVCLFLLLAACGAARAQTQSEMTAEACDEYKQTDEQLNAVYKQILREYQSDAGFIDRMKKAQRAWIAFRDAHLDAVYPLSPGEYGSAGRMCRCLVLTELTARRVTELRQWIDPMEEGDVCSGSRAGG